MNWRAILLASPAERIVPPSGLTAALILTSAAAMAFLAVVALSFAFAAGSAAENWRADLSTTATIRLPASAPEEEVSAAITSPASVPSTAPRSIAFAVSPFTISSLMSDPNACMTPPTAMPLSRTLSPHALT